MKTTIILTFFLLLTRSVWAQYQPDISRFNIGISAECPNVEKYKNKSTGLLDTLYFSDESFGGYKYIIYNEILYSPYGSLDNSGFITAAKYLNASTKLSIEDKNKTIELLFKCMEDPEFVKDGDFPIVRDFPTNVQKYCFTDNNSVSNLYYSIKLILKDLSQGLITGNKRVTDSINAINVIGGKEIPFLFSSIAYKLFRVKCLNGSKELSIANQYIKLFISQRILLDLNSSLSTDKSLLIDGIAFLTKNPEFLNWNNQIEHQKNIKWFNETVDLFKKNYAITIQELNSKLSSTEKIRFEFNQKNNRFEIVLSE